MEPTEGQIPGHLQLGWEAYREWWEARYRSGNPLPEGGVFLLDRRAVLLDELWRLHLEAAQGLSLPVEAITVDVAQDADGRLRPRLDVHFPDGWAAGQPFSAESSGSADRERLINEYVTGYLNVLYSGMQRRLKSRMAALYKIRLDLFPSEVVPCDQTDNTSC